MTAPVRIEASAWCDLRFATLARLCGFADAEHALIKCARIWSWQTEFYRPETPTYVVDRDTIESILGGDGPEAMVRAKLAEETPDGWRIRGSRGRIEWLYNRRESSARGGEANRRRLDAEMRLRRRGNGADKVEPLGSVPASCVGIRDRAADEPSVSVSGSGSGSDCPEISPAPVRLIHGAWARRQDWWTFMRVAHRRLRDLGIQPNAADFPAQCAGVNETNMTACERALRDGGYDDDAVDAKMRHVVLVIEAECVRDRTLRYFKPALIWDPARFNRAVDTPIDEAAQPKARAGPQRSGASIGAALPRTDHPVGDRLIPINEL